METWKEKRNRILLLLFLLSFVVYAVSFYVAFADLPLNIPTWHQFLLLYFHFVPMFFLEWLLCRTAKLRWRILLPLLPLVLVGLWFLSTAEWYLMAWFFFGIWCVPPVLGCLAGWGVWAIEKRLKSK